MTKRTMTAVKADRGDYSLAPEWANSKKILDLMEAVAAVAARNAVQAKVGCRVSKVAICTQSDISG